MARDIESLTLRMSADLRRFEKSMANMSAIADKRLTAVERQALKSQRNLSRIMERAGTDMVAGLQRGLAELAPVLAGAFSVAQVTRYADAWTAGRNSLAAAGVATSDLAGRQEELLRIANESRTSTEATIGLYSRLSIATQELGLSSQDTLRLTELLNKSFAASGGSAQEAASAALQLSQALASGTLQGDELRSLRENAPLIAKAIADSMGVSIGALKELGAEGKITAHVVTQALFAASADIESRFQSTQVTVGQALTVLDNQLGAFVGRADESLSATQRMAQALVDLANNLDDVADVVVVAATAIGVTLASRAIGGAVVSFTALRTQVALTNAQLAAAALQAGLASGSLGRMSVAGVAAAGSMRGLSAAMAFFGGPIGFVITGLATGIALLAVNAGKAEREAKELADEIGRQADAAKAAADQTARLAGEITDTERWAAALTGQTHLLADAHYRAAAAAKAQAIEEARLRVVQGRETLAQAREAYDRRYQRERQRFGVDPSNGRFAGIEGPNANVRERTGQAIVRTQEYENLVGATGNLNRATQDLTSLMSAPLERVSPATVAGSGGGGSAGAGGGGRGGSRGPDPEDVERQRELLALQMEIERLRVQGDESGALAKQRELDVVNLTKQLTDAGVANARETAEQHVRALATAEDAARGFEILAERNAKWLEDMEAANERLADQTRDRLGYEAELARLGGSEGMIRDAERRLFIHERTLEILRLQLAATKEQAAAMAGAEWDELDRTEAGRDMARNIVDVLRSDNIWEEAGRRFKDAAWDGIENLLSQLFRNINLGGGKGGGFDLFGALKGLIPGFSKGVTNFEGGLAYVHKGEVLTNLPRGTNVIPAAQAAMAGVAARGAGGQTFVVNVNASDAVLTETVRGWVREGMQQAVGQAVQTSTSIARRSAPGMQQQQRRLGTT